MLTGLPRCKYATHLQSATDTKTNHCNVHLLILLMRMTLYLARNYGASLKQGEFLVGCLLLYKLNVLKYL